MSAVVVGLVVMFVPKACRVASRTRQAFWWKKNTTVYVCASACVFVQSCELEQMGGGVHITCECVLWHGLG